MNCDGLVMELACCESTLLREIGDASFKRKDIAYTYALSLMSSERNRVDWKKVNYAIIDRWSLSALTWIKNKAWKLVEEKRKAGLI